MRHKKKFNHLSRKRGHRHAMLANMASSLILNKRIRTTTAKAKALKVYLEPLITKAKEDTTHSRRQVFSYLQDKDAVSELFREVAAKVADRPGGYTRIIKLGNRLGDSADMAIIELVDYNENLLAEKAAASKSRRRRRGGKKKSGQEGAEAAATAEMAVGEGEAAPATEIPATSAEETPDTEVTAEDKEAEKAPEAAEAEKKEDTPSAETPAEEQKEATPKAEASAKEAPEAKKQDEEKKDEGSSAGEASEEEEKKE